MRLTLLCQTIKKFLTLLRERLVKGCSSEKNGGRLLAAYGLCKRSGGLPDGAGGRKATTARLPLMGAYVFGKYLVMRNKKTIFVGAKASTYRLTL